MDKTKLMMDEFGLCSRSNVSSEPDSLCTKFCPIQIVTPSSGHYITMEEKSKKFMDGAILL